MPLFGEVAIGKFKKKSKYVKKKIGMRLFAGVYQDLAPTAFSGKK